MPLTLIAGSTLEFLVNFSTPGCRPLLLLLLTFFSVPSTTHATNFNVINVFVPVEYHYLCW